MASAPRRELLRIDTSGKSRVVASAQDQLLSAIADVLHIQKTDIQLYDSFTDLGGDQSTANALSRTCMSAGLTLKADEDIGRLYACANIACERLDHHSWDLIMSLIFLGSK